MRTGHLFAGAGGGLYADLILGYEPVFAVELDDYAARCLQERKQEGWFPKLHLYHGDVRLFNASAWKGKVDSIHAGFPCQDISVAGNGAGIEGERSGLWSEVVRVAGEIQPRELFLENSPAITSRGLGRVLGDLADLGFNAEWCVLSASAVGAPHIRARWWCLARLADASSRRCCEQEARKIEQQRRTEIIGTGNDTNTDSLRELQPQRREQEQRQWAGNIREKVANTMRQRQQGVITELIDKEKRQEQKKRPDRPCSNVIGWWTTEPGMGRVVDGLANRVHRIKALGNGQVPLQAAAAYIMLDARLGT